jgi:regulator of protease activity HflC (stomatin/prohibitin superfamily)
MGNLFKLFTLLLLSAVVVVGPQQIAVVQRNIGEAPSSDHLKVFGPGVYLIVPLIDSAAVYSKSVRIYTMAKSESGNDDSIDVVTKDGEEIHVEISVLYTIDPNNVTTLYTRYGNRFEEDFARPTLRAAVRNELAAYTAVEILEGPERSNMSDNILLSLSPVFSENGLIVRDALIRNIIFSDKFVQTYEATLIARLTMTPAAKP